MTIEKQIIKALPKPHIKKPAVKATPSFFEKFMNMEYWPYVVGALAIILLVILLVFLIKRRRSKETYKVSPKIEGKKLAGSDLVKVWKNFLKEVPNEFRRSIMLYKQFIVFGESGSGKSLLIDQGTDWKGQADQFYPSYTLDPLLQIYLGSKVLVQEIPPALLNDTSKQAHQALKKFWKSLFKKREPTVVVVLNGETLRTDPPESLKKLAQVIRGKINILSRIRKRPVKVCIALTHMDQMEGFLEFSNFLDQNNIPLRLEFTSKTDLQDLKTCLEPYEIHWPRALTTLPAKDYLKLISFLKTAPESLSALSIFTKTLQRPDPLSLEPDVVSLSLASHGAEEAHISNPFAVYEKDLKITKFRPLLKHQLAAAAIAVFAIGYLLFGYLYERNMINKLNTAMDSFEKNPPYQYDSVTRQFFVDVISELRYDQMLKFFPDFFPDMEQDIHQRILSNVRRFYLLPRLKTVGGEENEEEKTLYLLAVIFSTKNNDLGKLALEHKTEWAETLDLSQVLVEDYVKYNLTSKNITVPLNEIVYLTDIPSVYDSQQWKIYFYKIASAVQKPFITHNYLQKLVKNTASFLDIIQKSKSEDLLVNIYRQLKQEPSLSPYLSLYRKDDEDQLSQEPLYETLLYLRQTTFLPANTAYLNLDEFIEDARVMMNPKDRENKIFRFNIDTEAFVFNTKKWDELINRSKLTVFMRDFIEQNSWYDGLLFFKQEDEFNNIVMNPTNDGNLFFTGKGIVDGRFTRDAFERDVKPAIAKVPDFLKDLPLDEKEKVALKTFLLREVEAYSTRYFSELKNYYHQFGMKASTLKELFFILDQIQLPFSQFQDFMMTVKDNTILDFGDSPYLRSLALKLEVFNFLNSLMEERKGALPELDKYKNILKQMQEELKSNKPIAPNNETDGFNELNARLSPKGRIALSILRDEDESYLNLLNAWLDSAGISSGWEDLFLDPIRQVYLLALPEMETVIRKEWDGLGGKEIDSIKNKFPFKVNAISEVTVDEFKTAFDPHGEFWTIFNKFLAPFCIKRGSTWKKRESPFSPLKLPPKMLGTINSIITGSRTFWDEKKNPIPLHFLIKPLPLPRIEQGKPVVALSYLKSGKSAVFGFNQRPDWQSFKIEWWENQTATVGIEFKTSLDSSKSYRVITGPESPWSFYHLLRDAKIEDENILIWRFNSPESKEDIYAVQFEIKPDPWAIFRSGLIPVSVKTKNEALSTNRNKE